MTFKKDICVSKTRNIWIDYDHNHMFYITNLMDILPPEIAEDIWKTYWKYEYTKNFIREVMWNDIYMNKIVWRVENYILKSTMNQIQKRYGKFGREQSINFLYSKCGYLKKNGEHCENCYANNVYDRDNHTHIKRLIGNTRQLYNIEGGFSTYGTQSERSKDLPDFVKPQVCGIHSKNFDLTDYVHGLGYKMRNGYLCKTKGSVYYYHENPFNISNKYIKRYIY